MATATIIVRGMGCDGCANSVTWALKTVVGVLEANVDLQGEKATVRFDDTKTSVDALRIAIEDAGYDVE